MYMKLYPKCKFPVKEKAAAYPLMFDYILEQPKQRDESKMKLTEKIYSPCLYSLTNLAIILNQHFPCYALYLKFSLGHQPAVK